jgi:hypothetical protein
MPEPTGIRLPKSGRVGEQLRRCERQVERRSTLPIPISAGLRRIAS